MPILGDLNERQEMCRIKAGRLYEVSKEFQNVLKPYLGKRVLKGWEDFIEEIEEKISDLYEKYKEYVEFTVEPATVYGALVANFNDGIFFRIARVEDKILIEFYNLDEQLQNYLSELSLSEEQVEEIKKAYKILQNAPECLKRCLLMW